MMTNGKGFIALAAMIFGKWHPVGAFAGGMIFGFSDALQIIFQIKESDCTRRKGFQFFYKGLKRINP